MEMYLSGGVSTLVALMAAHRTGRDLPIPTTFDQGETARIGPGNFVIVPTDKPEQFDEAMRRRHGIALEHPGASSVGSPASR
jgi:hypothetical protein